MQSSAIESKTVGASLPTKEEIREKLDALDREHKQFCEKYASERTTVSALLTSSAQRARTYASGDLFMRDFTKFFEALKIEYMNAEMHNANYLANARARDNVVKKIALYNDVDAMLGDRDSLIDKINSATQEIDRLTKTGQQLRLDESDDGRDKTRTCECKNEFCLICMHRFSIADLSNFHSKWTRDIATFDERIKSAKSDSINSSARYSRGEITIEENLTNLSVALQMIKDDTKFLEETQEWIAQATKIITFRNGVSEKLSENQGKLQAELAKHQELYEVDLPKLNRAIPDKLAEIAKLD